MRLLAHIAAPFVIGAFLLLPTMWISGKLIAFIEPKSDGVEFLLCLAGFLLSFIGLIVLILLYIVVQTIAIIVYRACSSVGQ